MNKTGVKATYDEIEVCKKLATQAAHTPMIAFTTEAMMNGRDFASLAWHEAQEQCHKFALAHGLPEITGFYGMDENGEFVVAVPDGGKE